MTPEKRNLLAELEAARSNLGLHGREMVERTRPSNIVNNSLRQHPVLWAAGALAAGFVVARTLRAEAKPKNRRDTIGKTAKTGKIMALIAAPLMGMARKAVLSFATSQIQQLLHSPTQSQRSP